MAPADRINVQPSTSNFQSVVTLALCANVLMATAAYAHRLDEYLQAARVDLDLTHVEVRLALTPGVDVADTIVREIDIDHDGRLAHAEQAAYARRVLTAVHVDLDGRSVGLRTMAFRFPDVADLRRGEGTIAIQSAVEIPTLTPGPHRVHVMNRYHADIGAYLANALEPATSRIAITGQRRSADQSALTIDYVVRESAR